MRACKAKTKVVVGWRERSAFTLTVSLICTSCASTPREKVVQNMVIAGAVGAAIGQTQTEYPNGYSVMYAGLASATAGLVSLYVYDDLDNEKFKKENIRLKSELDEFQSKLEPKVIGQGNSLFTSPLPKEVSGLIQPGEWKRYKMDQWVQDQNDQNTWVRQTEMFVVTPPTSK